MWTGKNELTDKNGYLEDEIGPEQYLGDKESLEQIIWEMEYHGISEK